VEEEVEMKAVGKDFRTQGGREELHKRKVPQSGPLYAKENVV